MAVIAVAANFDPWHASESQENVLRTTRNAALALGRIRRQTDP
jgi:hypothetical protein